MKPKVITRCVANNYAGPFERIIELSNDKGIGCLVSVRNMPDGTMSVQVYRRDAGVTVDVSAVDGA